MSRLAVLSLTTLSLAMLSLAAPALAQQGETRPMAETIPGYQPSAFEQNLARLEPRLADFGARMEALSDDPALTEAERRAGKAALLREYGPDLIALSTSAAGVGLTVAGNLLQTLDIGALVEAALIQADAAVDDASIEVQAALAETFAELQNAGLQNTGLQNTGLQDAGAKSGAAPDHP